MVFNVKEPIMNTWDEASAKLCIEKETGNIEISILSDKIIKISYRNHNSTSPHDSCMVGKVASYFLHRGEIRMTENQQEVILTTESLQIVYFKQEGRVDFFDRNGKLLLVEQKEKIIMPPDSQRHDPKINCVQAEFAISEYAQFYGLGQHQNGLLGYVGHRILLQHKNMTIAIPFVVCDQGYGILWDNSGRTEIDFSKKGKMVWESKYGSSMEYYFIYGPSIDNVISQYYQLTGPAVLLPKWAFGFWQSKMRYMTQQELLDVAREYRKRKYPIDILVIDFYHWTQMGDFKFDLKDWPNPEEMFKELSEMNIKCMVSVWPTISEKSINFIPMQQKGYLIKNDQDKSVVSVFFNNDTGGLYDPFNEEARKYVFEKASYYYRLGARIWWLDACEPDCIKLEDVKSQGIYCSKGLLMEHINAYPLMHEKGFYEGQRALDPEKRVLLFARSAFVGSQRYGVAVWSGDIGHDFEALKKQITAGLNAAMSGIPFWTTDIGGFTGGNPESREYRELYIRWFQYGAFCPLFRVHGSRGATSHDDLIHGISRGGNELWSFGEELEAIMLKYNILRHKLLPYIYSAARETIHTGTPMMRALMIDFPADLEARGINDQFMFGKALMICPVTEQGATTKEVYLPHGTLWYDAWTGEKLKGGQYIIAKAPIERIPVYIKAGSIIPVGPNEQYVGEVEDPQIKLYIYRGEDGILNYYEDDGETYAYEDGDYCSIQIHWKESAGKLSFENQKGKRPLDLNTKFLTFYESIFME